MKLLYNQSEAAKLVGIDVKIFKYHVDKGDIRYILVGKKSWKKYTLEDINEFINNRKIKSCQPINRKAPRSGTTTSKYQAIDFAGLREQHQKKMQKPLKPEREARL